MTIRSALTAGIRAPVSQWRLVLILWLARLLPIALAFGLPLYAEIHERASHHPDAAQLLDPAGDGSGWAFAWISDTFREALTDTSDRIFWLVLFCWSFVAVLAGGITARLVHGGSSSGLFLAECGRYAGRFFRLAFLAAVLFYAVDVAVNSLLAESHADRARAEFTQDFVERKLIVRGLLFLTLLHLVGAVHTYAGIDIVANERRSSFLALVRGIGTLIVRFPKLFVLEVAMLLAVGIAGLLAWVLTRLANPLTAESSWMAIGMFLFLAAIGSYLRSGVELGTLAARCRLLGPAPVSQTETPAADDAGDLFGPNA